MPNEPRSFQPTTPQANRAAQDGQGVGQREMDAMQDANRTADIDLPEEDDFTDRSRLGDKNEADRGHGAKARARNKESFAGRLT